VGELFTHVGRAAREALDHGCALKKAAPGTASVETTSARAVAGGAVQPAAFHSFAEC
jgi:hypothetical protein